MRKKRKAILLESYRAICLDCPFHKDMGMNKIAASLEATRHWRRYIDHRVAWQRIETLHVSQRTDSSPELPFDKPPF